MSQGITVRSGIVAGSMGATFTSGSALRDEAAHVDRQVPRIALDRVRHREHLTDARVVRLEAALAIAIAVDLVELVPPRDQRAEPVHLLQRQTEHLAHFAQRALAAVRDDLAHHRRAIAAVLS